MPRYTYKGLTTHKLYLFNVPQAPPETVVVINGENCLLVNSDGSVQRGVAGATPAGNDPYATYASTSKWEQS